MEKGESNRIIIVHSGSACPRAENYVWKNHPQHPVEYVAGFRFSPGDILRAEKKLFKRHGYTFFEIPPPCSFIKTLIIYCMILFIPSGVTLVFSGEEQPLPVRRIQGFYLIPAVIPFILLSALVALLSMFYTWFAAGKLRNPRVKKFHGESLEAAFLAPSLHLLDTFRGSSSHVRGVVGGFRKLGWKLSIFAPGKIPGVEGNYFIIQPLFRNFLPGGLVDMLHDMVFFARALPIIKREKPAFLYQRHGRYCISGVLLSRMTGIPLVLETNALLAWESGYWSRTGGIRRRIIADWEKHSLLSADRVSAISEGLRENIIQAGVKPERVFVNPNGADGDKFHRKCGGDKIRDKLGLGNKIVAGFSGSFHPWHGIDTLKDTIEKAVPQFENIVFFLIGDGPERAPLEKSLGEQFPIWHVIDLDTEKEAVSSRVIFTGRIEPDLVPPCLDACDILLSPIGKGKEYSSPIKIFEYMAMGKAILCYDTGQMSRVFENGADALMTPPDDPTEFFQGLEKLVKDEDLRRSLGDSAEKKFQAGYSWKENVKRVVQSISELS